MIPSPPQLKQKLYQSQQRATLCSRTAEQAEASRGEAEQSRTVAEAKAVLSRQDKEQCQADRDQLSQELQRLKKEVGRTDNHNVQWMLPANPKLPVTQRTAYMRQLAFILGYSGSL